LWDAGCEVPDAARVDGNAPHQKATSDDVPEVIAIIKLA
jgi:hypothetical protein